MSDMLSQAEIDALLAQVESEVDAGGSGGGPEYLLTEKERGALAELFLLAFQGALQAWSELLGVEINLVGPQTQVIRTSELAAATSGAAGFFAEFACRGGLDGSMRLHLGQDGVEAVLAFLTGGDAGVGQLENEHLSIMDDAVGQLLTFLAEGLAGVLERDVHVKVKASGPGLAGVENLARSEDAAIAMAFDTELGGRPGPLTLYMPLSVAREAVRRLVLAEPVQVQPTAGRGSRTADPGRVVARGVEDGPATVQAARFSEFASSGGQGSQSIDLILDVPLEITVELGQTRRQVKEVLGLGRGSVIELDRLAGEAVDVMVNGRLIAKGEVVVIDENFGVRITDILSPAERVNHLR